MPPKSSKRSSRTRSKRTERSCFFSAYYTLTGKASCKLPKILAKDCAPFIYLTLTGGPQSGHVKGCLHLLLTDKQIKERAIVNEIVDVLSMKIEMFSSVELEKIDFEEVTVAKTVKSRDLG